MSKSIKDPGFGARTSGFSGRMINNDGSFNIERKNGSWRTFDAYHYLINLSWRLFFLWSLLAFVVTNLCFSVIYLILGVKTINVASNGVLNDLAQAFFFSVQTLTSLGYGSLAPKTIFSGAVSSFEAFIGLVMFAFLTGLIYGRFSKPKSSIRFSKHIVYRDFNKARGLMFRVVNNRASVMIKPKISVTLSLSTKTEEQDLKRNFYNLELERDSITYLPTTWTIVHEINQESPLFAFTKEALIRQNGELLIMITYYDESFNQEVHQMYSYQLNEILLDQKFKQAYTYNQQGQMVLDYNLFDEVEALKTLNKV